MLLKGRDGIFRFEFPILIYYFRHFAVEGTIRGFIKYSW